MPDYPIKPKISRRLWVVIIGLTLVTIVLVAYSALSLRDVVLLTEKEIPAPEIPEITQPKSPEFGEDDSETEPGPEASSNHSKSVPPPSQIPYAEPVVGNPLAVRLPGENAMLGEISIEKYDSDGNATGEPLDQGTPVQIPDPNKPGEKIYFRVP